MSPLSKSKCIYLFWKWYCVVWMPLELNGLVGFLYCAIHFWRRHSCIVIQLLLNTFCTALYIYTLYLYLSEKSFWSRFNSSSWYMVHELYLTNLQAHPSCGTTVSVTQICIFSLSKHTKQLVLVISCVMAAGMEASFWTER